MANATIKFDTIIEHNGTEFELVGSAKIERLAEDEFEVESVTIDCFYDSGETHSQADVERIEALLIAEEFELHQAIKESEGEITDDDRDDYEERDDVDWNTNVDCFSR